MTTNNAFSQDDINTSSNSKVGNNDIKEVDHVSDFHSEVPPSTEEESYKTNYVVVLVLFFINLLNYIDRYTLAGVLDDVTEYYHLSTTQSGMLQTSFIIVYMLMSPIFGYLGDRFSRKNLILGGVTVWSLITLASSFVPENLFYLFLVMRSLVGVGEASYSTVAPTILSDLFSGDMRTKVMAFFFFAVPVGGGLGFIVGFGLKQAFGKWQYALRLSPILGIICVVLLFFLVKEPERGRVEGGSHLAVSPWVEDIRQLTKNRSFMLVSLGFTCVCFVIGALSWYTVMYLNAAIDAKKNKSKAYSDYNTAIIFGAMTMVAGVIGVLIGTESGRRLRKIYKSSDPVVCAIGLILASPFIVIALVLAKNHLNWSLFAIFLAQTSLCLNWALVTDMTMGIVIPTRRASASAYQMILSHAFGDAGSPYIIGLIRDSVNFEMKLKYSVLESEYYSLQYSLLINPFVSVLGGAFFLWASIYIVKDKLRVLKLIEESRFHYETVGSNYQPEDSTITPYPSICVSPEPSVSVDQDRII